MQDSLESEVVERGIRMARNGAGRLAAATLAVPWGLCMFGASDTMRVPLPQEYRDDPRNAQVVHEYDTKHNPVYYILGAYQDFAEIFCKE